MGACDADCRIDCMIHSHCIEHGDEETTDVAFVL